MLLYISLTSWLQWVPGLSWGKQAEPWRWPPTTSSAEVKERVELHLYSTSGPSWPVIGWTLPLSLPTLFMKRSILLSTVDGERFSFLTLDHWVHKRGHWWGSDIFLLYLHRPVTEWPLTISVQENGSMEPCNKAISSTPSFITKCKHIYNLFWDT